MNQLLRFTDKGIYCPKGDFYIDPWGAVERAVITHAHSDHARFGSKSYLAHKNSAPLLKLRLGDTIQLQTVDYNETIFINGVKISLHPAGHIIGSAQVRAESEGQVWVASGDYKTEDDGISGAFESVKCNVFITESTFGLPVYRWKKQNEIYGAINAFWLKNKEAGKNTVLFCYSAGKAQRVIQCLDKSIGPVYGHAAIYNTQQALINFGLPLQSVKQWFEMKPKEVGAVIIAPPSAQNSPWINRFEPYATGVCSGWMQVRGNQRRRNCDEGFALSDHADWGGLLETIKLTGAEKVFVTHGYQAPFTRYLNETGTSAEEVITEFGNESEEQIPQET